MHDVLIIGGGPAGLSAALALGRSRRNVLVFDKGEPRNAASKAMHGFISRDGIDPKEFLRLGREEVLRYPGVELLCCEVVKAERKTGRFTVQTDSGAFFEGRILLLATGILDELPPLEGIERFYGRSVHHCPYCDGWEHRDEIIAVYGAGRDGLELGLKMRGWSDRIVFCPSSALGSEEIEILHRNQVQIKEGVIERLEGEGAALSGIAFKDGSKLNCSALFFSTCQRQRSALAASLGCNLLENGQMDCSETQATNVEGVFAIGNASRGLQLVIIAAAEGTKAAFIIDEALRQADLKS